MKQYLFAAVVISTIAVSYSLECYTDCMELNTETINTSKCKKLQCPTNQKFCLRTTTLVDKKTTTTLAGCVPAKQAECKTTKITTNGVTNNMKNCYCDYDLCNGAMSNGMSMATIGFALATFIFKFLWWRDEVLCHDGHDGHDGPTGQHLLVFLAKTLTISFGKVHRSQGGTSSFNLSETSPTAGITFIHHNDEIWKVLWKLDMIFIWPLPHFK